jgi:hypothetical protein
MKKPLFIALGVILLILAQPAAVTMAQGSEAILRPDPLALGLKPEEHGTVAILIENVQNLYGVEFHLAFDPAVVEVVDADPAQEGVQIAPGSLWRDGFVAVNRADNERGQVDFAATLLNPSLPVSGDRAAAEITLRARQAGVSPVRVAAAILSTRQAEEIPFIAQAGAIGVNPGGTAPEVQAILEQAGASTGSGNRGAWALAGLSIVVFSISLGVFIHVLRRKK